MVTPIRFLLLALGMVCFSHISYGSFISNVHNPDAWTQNIDREKVYLHMDRSDFYAGERMWFKAYVVQAGTNKPVATNEIVYVDLINTKNEVLITKMLQTEQGSASGDILIPLETTNGMYTVRAYTNFMRNLGNATFFRKNIRIGGGAKLAAEKVFTGEKPITDLKDAVLHLEKPDLQFFPEGGNLVNGFINRMGFKLVAPDGLGANINGRVVDGLGKLITEFAGSHLGMGMLSFIPQNDEKYLAEIQYNGNTFIYPLPNGLVSGTMMHVFDRGEHYQVEIKSSRVNGVDGLQLTAFQGGEVISKSKIEGRDQYAAVALPKVLIKDGIVQFTLYDSAGQPICERLFFHHSDGEQVVMESSKKQYGKRELVDLEIKLDEDAADFAANMSLSVSEAALSAPKMGDIDIKTYLLLTSELKGEIENPSYYFNSGDPARRKNLDFLMMTQGWRSFIDHETEELRFPRETGITLKGRVVQSNSRDNAVPALVSLAYKNRTEAGYDVVETNENGEFEFSDLHFKDSTSIFVYANALSNKNKKSKRNRGSDPSFFIELDSFSTPEAKIMESLPLKSNEVDYVSAYPVVLPENKPFKVDGADLIRLKEAIVTENKLDKEANMKRKRKSALYIRPSYSLDYEQFRNNPIGNALTALQGRIPGVTVIGEQVSIRNRYDIPPFFLLDGFPVAEQTIFDIPVTDIDFVDYIRPGATAMYGMNGGNGIIAVYTLDGRERFYKKQTPTENGVGTLSYVHPGFVKSKKFYQPVFNKIGLKRGKADFRRTLHWEPNVELSPDGKVKVSFYTSDLPATYQATLQGVTDEGTPIHSKVIFESE
ncbi:TonB-dependent receptor plug domain-containing protein [Flagellimonas flava]|uniref:TonB-dependent receptor n=1 Tax=Flagellimonas flava TaxID=570519 RepID=UPI003D65EF94